MEQIKEMERNGSRLENFGIFFGDVLTVVKKVLFLEGALVTTLCLQSDLRFF